MNNFSIIKDKKLLLRQITSIWVILFVCTVLFFIIVRFMSLIQRDRGIVVIISFLLVLPVLVYMHISVYKLNYRINYIFYWRLVSNNRLSFALISILLLVVVAASLDNSSYSSSAPPLMTEATTIASSVTQVVSLPNVIAADSPTSTPIANPTPFTSIPPSGSSGIYYVAADSLRLRLAPGINQPIIGRLSRGTKVELASDDPVIIGKDKWVHVFLLDGRTARDGWVSADFLSSDLPR
jgi:hypothetical protein